MPEPTVMESKKTNPELRHADRGEDVVFAAEQDCSVLFDNGVELKLKAGKPKSVAFHKDGTYPFTLSCKGQCTPTSPIIVP